MYLNHPYLLAAMATVLGAHFWLVLPATGIASAGVAALTFTIVERPFLLLRALKDQRTARAVAAAAG